MPLTSLDELKAFQGATSTDATRDASLTAILAEVEAAIVKKCRPYQFEPLTISNIILDAPWQGPELHLPVWPVRSITSLYYRSDARGDASLFTSDHLLTAHTDYMLVVDDKVNSFSRSGTVVRLNRSVWGVDRIRPLDRLGWAPRPQPGAIKVTFAAGHTIVPADVVLAVHLAAGLMYQRRAGAPVTSESWNGYSSGVAGQFTATAAVNSPDVLELLSPYVTPLVVA